MKIYNILFWLFSLHYYISKDEVIRVHVKILILISWSWTYNIVGSKMMRVKKVHWPKVLYYGKVVVGNKNRCWRCSCHKFHGRYEIVHSSYYICWSPKFELSYFPIYH